MKKIGLISDTHGFVDDKIIKHLEKVDEIWHAGDIGSWEVVEKLEALKPFKAVYGNIDNQKIRAAFPKHNRFLCEQTDVWITHIGGYPGRYSRNVIPEIYQNPPKLFICGHSHILKVMFDKKLGLLHINPGAAGNIGFHKIRTMVRFEIHNSEIKNLEVIELGKRSEVQDFIS
ncbi:MAG: metallophosphoesterase [Bacteroidetes bacterium]|nr:MAG: metallophosphoesterase [Bacteroidota bacterium]